MSLPNILMEVEMFGDESEADGGERHRKDLCWILEALTQRNMTYLSEHPDAPRLYRSGVTYSAPNQTNREAVPELAAMLRVIDQRKLARDADAQAAWQRVIDVFGGERFRDVPNILRNGGGDCFPLSQRIIVRSKSTGMYELLALGELRLVYPAYEALSYNFSRAAYEFRNIIGFADKGEREVSRARLSNGTELIATNDHKFWAIDGNLPDMERIESRTMGEFVEAQGMPPNRRRTSSRIIQASKIPALSAVSPSPSEAYLAGIYAAEGNFDGKHTCIAQHKPMIRARVESALADVGTSFRYRAGSGRTPGSGAYYALHGGEANPIVAMMRRQGLSSFDKSIPQSFLSADEAIIDTVIEGHGDGDAWRPAVGDSKFQRPNVAAIYATSSDRLMEQLRLGMLITGRPFYSYHQRNHMGAGKEPIWRLHEWDRENATKIKARRELVGEVLPGLTYGTVRSAEAAGTAHVGCIEVEGNHNFLLSDGTLVSNCDNMNCWRAAELRLAGIPASPYVTSRHQGNRTIMHAIVEHPDGSAEDPSRILGMGGNDGDSAAKRAEEHRKNDERRALLAQGIRRKVESGSMPRDAGVVALDTIVGIFPTAKERVALGLA